MIYNETRARVFPQYNATQSSYTKPTSWREFRCKYACFCHSEDRKHNACFLCDTAAHTGRISSVSSARKYEFPFDRNSKYSQLCQFDDRAMSMTVTVLSLACVIATR